LAKASERASRWSDSLLDLVEDTSFWRSLLGFGSDIHHI
jgi:hypothetical protein